MDGSLCYMYVFVQPVMISFATERETCNANLKVTFHKEGDIEVIEIVIQGRQYTDNSCFYSPRNFFGGEMFGGT